MAVKTPFTHEDFVNILSEYDLGELIHSEAIKQGTVQTNFFIQTTKGKFVFRYYENRSKESVIFESHLLAYLTEHHYPCPTQLKNIQETYVGRHCNKPYVIFEFIEGQHIEHPSAYHKQHSRKRRSDVNISLLMWIKSGCNKHPYLIEHPRACQDQT